MDNKVQVALGIAGGAVAGVVAGVILRQPEINKLQKQVKVLQDRLQEMEEVVKKQNADIATLLVQRESLKIYQFIKRQQLDGQIRELLVEQYAAADYINLLIGRIKGGPDLTDEEILFYRAYKKQIDDKRVSEEERQTVDAYVYKRHGTEIGRLEPCDTQVVFDELRRYNEETQENEKEKRRLFFWKKKS